MSSNRRIGLVTGLIDAQARQAEGEAGKARAELDGRRFDDMVAQRDRFTSTFDRIRERHESKVFDYHRALQWGVGRSSIERDQ